MGGGGRGEDHTVSGGTRGDLSFPTKYKGAGNYRKSASNWFPA